MASQPRQTAEARQHPRIKLPAMYTLVRVKPKDHPRFCWTGYIYDISASGMRFELDEPVDPGTEVEVRAMLPGAPHTTFTATGNIVRIHEPQDERYGPIRMGMTFSTFAEHTDQRRLDAYLQTAGRRAA